MLLYLSCVYLLAGAKATHLIGLAGSSQYHSQDALGQYSYGYIGGPSAKVESKGFDGITRGGYSYIDANGILQSVNYIADPVNGFRVAATNLPQAPLPEGFKAVEPLPTVKFTSENVVPVFKFENLPALPLVKFEDPTLPILKFDPALPPQKLENPISAQPENPTVKFAEEKLTAVKGYFPETQPSAIATVQGLKLSPLSTVNLSPLPLGLSSSQYFSSIPNYYYSDLPYVPLSTFPKAPLPKFEEKTVESPKEEAKDRSKRAVVYTPFITHLLPSSSQYEFKDNIGNYAYGYQNPLSSKTESRFFGGLTKGAYNYVDANGLLQSVHYTADGNGFRVAATNLPVA